MSDRLSEMAWEFARAYCPKPGDNPCFICHEDALDELCRVETRALALTDEQIAGLKTRLGASRGLDILELAVTIGREVVV